MSETLGSPFLLSAIVVGYLLGSIPFGLILTRLGGAGDLRSIGSGNIGATNVLRTGRYGLAALTLIGDALKGTAAVLLGARLGPEAAAIAGLGAFLGHLFPIWLRFKGGKGVATFLGVWLGLYWPVALAFAIVWLSVAAITRYSSLAALSASLAVPLSLYATGRPAHAVLAAAMAALLWWKHAANIRRLADGTESRIGSKES
jgi:glycerol-3-phosphate acyltransferase PlsY